MNEIGIRLGRLSNNLDIDNGYFKSNIWKDEFKLADEIGLKKLNGLQIYIVLIQTLFLKTKELKK